MTTHEFLEALGPHQEKPLIFDLGKRVSPGYHVTEVKTATVHSMDCGGKSNQWFETTLQLWAPERTRERDYMRVGKFLSIYRRVAAGVPTVQGATVRVEYGDVGAPAISYLIREIDVDDHAVVIQLEPPAVACKANALGVGDIPVVREASGCCVTDSAAQGGCGL